MKNIKTIQFNYNGISLANAVANEIKHLLAKYMGNVININIIQAMKCELQMLLSQFNYIEHFNIKEKNTYNIIIEYKIYGYDELILLDIGLK